MQPHLVFLSVYIIKISAKCCLFQYIIVFLYQVPEGEINAIELCCIVSLPKSTEKLPAGKMKKQIGEQMDKWTKEEQMLDFM